ncbi:MAG: DUF3656 domain-containing protein [Clostridiales bacterium]|nr:DUF3656 domain-containing protein [Clostridiales bacterium]
MIRKPEVLAPAGSFEALKEAVNSGADAVYLAGSAFGARAYADNFNEEKLCEGIDYAHLYGVKVYLTVNTLIKEDELTEKLYDFIKPYYLHGLDAVLVQDLGAAGFLKKHFPDLPLHASTQMTVTGINGVKLLEEFGFERVVTARELSLYEVKDIIRNCKAEIECFVHGAMCYCYSGQCLLSSIIGGRSGNRGRCAQPCRLPYRLNKEKNPRHYMSLRDMNSITILPELIEAGVASLKIEGRMKNPEYAGIIAGIYRKYVDIYCDLRNRGLSPREARKRFCIEKSDMEILSRYYIRSNSGTGYYKERNGRDMITPDNPGYTSDRAFFEKIEKQRANLKRKLSINGFFEGHMGEPASFTAYNDTFAGCGVSENPMSEALSRPLTSKELEGRLKKTGQTAFEFETIDFSLGENTYLDIKSINALRRDALHQLERQIVESYHREDKSVHPETSIKNLELEKYDKPGITALVRNKMQFDFCLERNVESIYPEVELWSGVGGSISDMAELCQSRGIRLIPAMPFVLREEDLNHFREDLDLCQVERADGVLVRNLEEIAFFKKNYPGLPLIADSGVYTWNRNARETLKELGIQYDTVPLELNRNELRRRGLAGSELVIYGYLPLMVTAQCLKKNSSGCTKTPGIFGLCDRYNNIFKVENVCQYCHNVIYNSLPLSLLAEEGFIGGSGLRSVRLCFLDEDYSEMKAVFEALSSDNSGDTRTKKLTGDRYTRGHFARGVE